LVLVGALLETTGATLLTTGPALVPAALELSTALVPVGVGAGLSVEVTLGFELDAFGQPESVPRPMTITPQRQTIAKNFFTVRPSFQRCVNTGNTVRQFPRLASH
jgi:hypothetical protein